MMCSLRWLARCLCLVTAANAASSSLRRRDTATSSSTPTPTPLVRVDIPLSLDDNERYIANVNMSSGPNTQSFKFAVAANSGYSAVAGVACDSCDGVPTYNASASTSSEPLPGTKNVTFSNGSAGGALGKDDCGLRETNGVAWQYPNQTIIVANASSDLFGDSVSGIIGLGTNSDGSDFEDTIFGQWMLRNPNNDNFSFGMALNTPDSSSGDGGLLHWLVPDSSFYEGEVSYKTVVAPSSGSNNTAGLGTNATPQNDWVVEMDGWFVESGTASTQNVASSLAVIEPWFPNIYFPFQEAEAFYAIISGAALQSNLVDGAQAWSIPCDSQFTLGLQFGQSFLVDQSNLIVQNGNSCIGAVQAWSNSSETSFLLGGRFISSLYLIFTIGRPQSGVNTTIGFANLTPPTKSKPVGAIVGGTVGGVALIAAIIAGIFVALRLRKRRKAAILGRPSKNATSAYEDGTSDFGHEGDKSQYATHIKIAHAPYSPPLSSATSDHPLLADPQSPPTPYRDGTGPFAAAQAKYPPTQFTQFTPRTGKSTFTAEPFLVPLSADASASTTSVSQTSRVQQWIERSPVPSMPTIPATSPSLSMATNPSVANNQSESQAWSIDPFVMPPASSQPPSSTKHDRMMAPVRQPTAPPAYETQSISASSPNSGGVLPMSPTLVEDSAPTESNDHRSGKSR